MSAQPVEISTERMAAWMMAKFDAAWPLHRFHHRSHKSCPWCAIMFPVERDYRDDVEFGLANAGALS